MSYVFYCGIIDAVPDSDLSSFQFKFHREEDGESQKMREVASQKKRKWKRNNCLVLDAWNMWISAEGFLFADDTHWNEAHENANGSGERKNGCIAESLCVYIDRENARHDGINTEESKKTPKKSFVYCANCGFWCAMFPKHLFWSVYERKKKETKRRSQTDWWKLWAEACVCAHSATIQIVVGILPFLPLNDFVRVAFHSLPCPY